MRYQLSWRARQERRSAPAAKVRQLRFGFLKGGSFRSQTHADRPTLRRAERRQFFFSEEIPVICPPRHWLMRPGGVALRMERDRASLPRNDPRRPNVPFDLTAVNSLIQRGVISRLAAVKRRMAYIRHQKRRVVARTKCLCHGALHSASNIADQDTTMAIHWARDKATLNLLAL